MEKIGVEESDEWKNKIKSCGEDLAMIVYTSGTTCFYFFFYFFYFFIYFFLLFFIFLFFYFFSKPKGCFDYK
jgi:hypothetical protein